MSLDLKEHLKRAILLTRGRLVNDLKALTGEQSNACPGGCARPALSIVAECAAVNGMMAKILTGEEYVRPAPEERDRFLASFDTPEKALTFLNTSTDTLIAAIEGFDADRFGETTDQIGRAMTYFDIAELPAMHMSYHDGQLNYIQALSGDAAIHW